MDSTCVDSSILTQFFLDSFIIKQTVHAKLFNALFIKYKKKFIIFYNKKNVHVCEFIVNADKF